MKVVILAGGIGSRIGSITQKIPKPMIKIGKDPILIHIMKIYSFYGHKDFIISLGYKSEIIKKFFLKKKYKNYVSKKIIQINNFSKKKWNILLVETGVNTMTGGRIKLLKKFIGKETFMFTYGDGVANININKLILQHQKTKKIITVSAVRPIARFGELILNKNKVTSFVEKPQTTQGWINGGFFISEPEIFKFIKNKNTVLEESPLETLSKKKQLMAYLHKGFWRCLDTVRDLESLNLLWKQKKAYWKIW